MNGLKFQPLYQDQRKLGTDFPNRTTMNFTTQELRFLVVQSGISVLTGSYNWNKQLGKLSQYQNTNISFFPSVSLNKNQKYFTN